MSKALGGDLFLGGGEGAQTSEFTQVARRLVKMRPLSISTIKTALLDSCL